MHCSPFGPSADLSATPQSHLNHDPFHPRHPHPPLPHAFLNLDSKSVPFFPSFFVPDPSLIASRSASHPLFLVILFLSPFPNKFHHASPRPDPAAAAADIFS
ncbi:unnamed protein product [Periconia digitata]|uniref:Uncharacterized protein n=1 Tax=Periconia digitata TaxID=1303443 RepID=A0A9W4UAX1_9PLEO|nr:unnamed protein product [Periconia digitata]